MHSTVPRMADATFHFKNVTTLPQCYVEYLTDEREVQCPSVCDVGSTFSISSSGHGGGVLVSGHDHAHLLVPAAATAARTVLFIWPPPCLG